MSLKKSVKSQYIVSTLRLTKVKGDVFVSGLERCVACYMLSVSEGD